MDMCWKVIRSIGKWVLIGVSGFLVVVSKLVGDLASYVYDVARGTGESEKLKAEVGMDVKKS